MKQCSKCQKIKLETEFYKDKRTRDGLKCQCKKCHNETNIATRNEERFVDTIMTTTARMMLSGCAASVMGNGIGGWHDACVGH